MERLNCSGDESNVSSSISEIVNEVSESSLVELVDDTSEWLGVTVGVMKIVSSSESWSSSRHPNFQRAVVFGVLVEILEIPWAFMAAVRNGLPDFVSKGF